MLQASQLRYLPTSTGWKPIANESNLQYVTIYTLIYEWLMMIFLHATFYSGSTRPLFYSFVRGKMNEIASTAEFFMP